MAKAKAKATTLTEDEIHIIKTHCVDPAWTDEKIAQKIGRSAEVVRKYRRKFGISKQSGKVTVTEGSLHKEQINKANLTDDEKIELWQRYFRTTARYKRLQKQLIADDLDYFCESWAKYCVQFDDLKASEEDQLELLVTYKMRIEDNRKDYKGSQENEERLVRSLGDKGTIEDIDLENENDRYIYEMILSNNRIKQELNKAYQELCGQAEKYFKMLNSTREQRELHEKVGAETFVTLVRQMTDQKHREKVGQYNEYMRIATEQHMQKYKESHEFLDGAIEPIIMEGKDFVAKNNEPK